MGYGATIRDPGSGQRLWGSGRRQGQDHGHRGNGDGAELAVAEPVRGKCNRVNQEGMPRPQCATNTPAAMEVWSCVRDGGGPLGAGGQAQAPNYCKLRPLRAVVVSVAEKAGEDPVR